MEILKNALDSTVAVMTLLVFWTLTVGYVIGVVNSLYVNNVRRILGYNKITPSVIIGVPVHEIGHYLMCKIFGVKVEEVKLLNLDSSNTLGYVRYSFNKGSLRHRISIYFISLGPLYIGSLIVLIVTRVFMGEFFYKFINVLTQLISNSEYSLVGKIYTLVSYTLTELYRVENFKNIGFWIFILITTSISLHSDLSGVDVKNSLRSLPYLFVITVGVSIVDLLTKDKGITNVILTINIALICAISLLLVFSITALIFSYLMRILLRK